MDFEQGKKQLALGTETLKEKIPYFPYSVAGIIILLLGGLFFFFSATQSAAVTIAVVNAAGANVRDAQISVTGLEAPLNIVTDKNGIANFTVPVGSNIRITVKKQDYADENKSVLVSDNLRLDFKLKQKGIAPPKEINVLFVGPDGKKLIGKQVSVKLSCTGPAGFDPDQLNVTQGELKLVPPANCGSVKINASSSGFKEGFATLTSRTGQVTLEGLERPKASVDFDVKDAQSGRYVDGLVVSLFTLDNIPTGYSSVTSFGSASFTKIEADSYIAIIDDPQGQYSNKRLDVALTENAKEKIQVLVSKDLKLRAIATVKEGTQKVSGATVHLYSGLKIAGQGLTDTNGQVAFALDESGDYSMQASKENYLPGKKLAFSTSKYEKGSTQHFDLNIEKCTPTKCGLLTIRVMDEDNLPVENATLSLLGEDGLVATAFGTRATDFNGFAKFQNGTAGKFYIFAQKFPSEGKSELIEVVPTEETKAQMTITIGLGNVVVKAQDIDGKPLSQMNVELFTSSGRSLGSVPVSENGTGAIKVKADKKVYAVFKKEGYTSHFTVARQVFPNKNLEFSATLEKSIAGDTSRIFYKGFFSEQGAQAEALRAGSAYTGKFVLEIPSDKSFSQAAAFFRAGNKEKASLDIISIEEINAPTLLIFDGQTYNAPLGNDMDDENGSGKWSHVSWKNPVAGRYEIEVKARVKQGTAPGTELAFFYRADAEKDARYYRHPQDTVLGTEKDNAQKKGFYANSHELRFLEGIAQLCQGPFCFSHRVLDKTDNLYVEDPYKLRAYSSYELEFVLINNSDKDYTGSGMYIANPKGKEDIQISSYSIRNADNSAFTGAAKVFEIAQFSTGEFTKNRRVSGNLQIETQTTQPSTLLFKIFSNQEERYSAAIPFVPYTEGSIALEAKPENLVAFIPLNLEIKAAVASGEESGFPVEGAKIFLKRLSPDRTQTILNAVTDKEGKAKISVPASSPGTKVIIWGQKAGLGSNVVERQVTAGVAAFDPEKIIANLNRQTKTQARTELSVTNLVGRPIVIKKFSESVQSKGILDEEKMANFLTQFVGREIEPNDGGSITVLSAIGKEADFLEKPKKISGLFFIEWGIKDDPNTTWISKIPYEANVNLAEMPANSPCIALSESTWEDSTMDNRSTLDFEITNNCVSDNGEGIDLLNLQSKIDWTGTDGTVGIVEISVTDTQTGEIAREILQQSLSNKLLSRLKYGKLYAARLTFVPKPNAVGKKAEFNVSLDAEIVTNSGKQLVGVEDEIEALITVANIDRCIKFTPQADEGLRLLPNQTEAEFTIDTTECGPVDIDIRFCGEKNNYQCRGGTNQGGIGVSPDHFTRLRMESRNIKVTRQDISGFYGLTVQARPSGSSFRKIAEFDVIIEPEEGDYFTLDKYAFTTIGTVDSKDSATLTNKMLQENIQVTANLCEWEAAEPGLSDGEKAGIALGGAAAGAAAGYLVVAAGLASTGVGAVIGLVVFIVIMFMTLFGEDPCEQFQTQAIIDYVINLTGTNDPDAARYIEPDAIDIVLDNAKLRGSWMTDVSDAVQKINNKYRNGKQTVGVVFENTGIEQEEPVYTIATLRAKEHVHGDATHQNPAVQCGTKGSESGDFGMFWINPGHCGHKGQVYDTTYTQKVHLKFKISEDKTYIPKVDFDTLACQSGLEIGRSGTGALPRVKFNWSWNESQGGITKNQCDVSNPDYIYCDATQFTIELNKKLYSLDQFLQANNYDLGCPLLLEERKEAQEAQDKANNGRMHQVGVGLVGVEEIVLEQTEEGFNAIVTSINNTDSDQNIVVQIFGGNNPTNVTSCQFELLNMAPEEDRNGSCNIFASEETTYYYTAKILSSSSQTIDPQTVSTVKIRGNLVEKMAQKACKLRTTETIADIPQIMRFIDGKDNIRWTQDVPDKQALEKLLIFDAYLIKDNYSPQFFRDFSKHYSEIAFEDTDTYFRTLGESADGERYGFKNLMDSGKFIVRNKYIDTSALSAPGIYRVEFAVYFLGNDWRLFGESKEPQGYVAVIMHRVSDPKQDSPFYSMPFDGLVGVDGDVIKRQNYGTSFLNDGAQPLLFISETSMPMKTFQDSSSNPVSTASVKRNDDIYSLNTAPGTRGMIFEINSDEGKNHSIVFQPSVATPLMIKVRSQELLPELSARYSLIENNNRLTTGTSLAYWSGAGTCLDFSGIPVTEAFYETPDRQGKETDKILDYQSTYAVDWKNTTKKGDVYLRTIMYTNASKDTKIRVSTQSAAAEFFTPDEHGDQISLNGIAGMPLNNYLAGSAGRIESMQDIFDLVQSNKACITSTGSTARFFWNPQSIYTAQGQQRNISQVSNSLEAASTCIG